MKVRHLFSALRIAATYSIMTTSSSKIADSFPVKTLTPIATSLTKPTYASLQIAQLQLNGNATSIASDSGDGILGHLQLTIKPAAYQAASQGNVPFIAPVNPGAAPVHGNGATGAQIAETNRQWKEDRTIFRLYHEVDKALRNQVIDAVHPHYIRALHDNLLGYGSLTCLQLLDHLWTNYGTITQDELDQNVVRMTQAWSPPTPIETLFTQLDDGIIFATAGGEVPAEKAVLRMGYNVIEANGLFDLPCTKWRTEVAIAEKTMANFKKHFRAADIDRNRNMTAGNSGYHGSNKATAQLIVEPQVNMADVIAQAIAAANAAVAVSDATSYCWTHGTSKNVNHTSSTCKNKSDGHKDDATSSNKMKGSDKVWGPKK